MILFILFIFIALALMLVVDRMFDNGMLSHKQYKFYLVVLIIFILFFVGKIQTL